MFFVDDIQVIYHKNHKNIAQKIIDRIKSIYELKDLGDIEWFLGIRILKDRKNNKLWLVHNTYIKKIAERFKLNNGKANTPLPVIVLVKNIGKAMYTFIKIYQEKIGSILYIIITVRADVAFITLILNHFLTNPF